MPEGAALSARLLTDFLGNGSGSWLIRGKCESD